MAPAQKERIVILGGGLSALVTAYELTNLPGWSDRYEISVHQMGWRLGGKGASGRNLDQHDRIEEHGLHIFFGFYENAFRVMRGVYQELGRHPDAPLSTWQQAFKKQNLIVSEQMFQGQWRQWVLPAPENSQVPGDGSPMIDPWSLFQELLQLLVDSIDPWWKRERDHQVSSVIDSLDEVSEHIETIAKGDLSLTAHVSLLEALGQAVLKQVALVGKVAAPLASAEMSFLHLAHRLTKRMPKDPTQHTKRHHDTLTWLMRGFRERFVADLSDDGKLDWEAFQIRTLIDLGLSAAIGMLVDDLIVPPVNWQKIDDYDFRQWLQQHGASQTSVDAAPIRGMRSAAFSTDDTAAAGTSLYLILRLLFTYKGAMLWEMQAGMGDTIFAPLYTVLKRRGVRFEFFQRIDRLTLTQPDAAGRRRIGSVVIGQQATLSKPYDPLVDVKGLPCWPSRPKYDYLNEGAQLQADDVNLEDWWTTWKDPAPPKVLQAGRDFDKLVLGISIGALPYVCEELVNDEHNPRFKQMIGGVKTTITQAAQLWLTPDLAKLGWPLQKPVVVGYSEPFDTWSDMSHLIERENWPERTVGNLAYFCSRMADEPGNPLPPRTDHAYPQRLRKRVQDNVRSTFATQTRVLWPWATTTDDPNCLNWSWLVDPKDRVGVERLAAQYSIAVWNPSDRYVLSVAGSTKYRLMPDESGYDNLVLTGDWTRNGFSMGCVEATVASGMHASRALCGYPKHIVGEWMDALPRAQRHSFEPEIDQAAVRRNAAAVDVTPPTPGQFISRDGDLLPLQPFHAEGSTMNWFVFDAKMSALQALCDSTLNFPESPIQYRPFLPLVCFIACDIAKMYPTDTQYNKGWMAERDFAFWVPVIAGQMDNGKFKPLRTVFYNPYMFVDSSPACEGGREIYGLMKSVAACVQPLAPADAPIFNVNTLVIPIMRPGEQVIPAELLRVHEPGSTTWGVHQTKWQSMKEAADEIETLVRALKEDSEAMEADWELGLSMLEDALQSEAAMVSLRQYPDVRDGHLACYQTIVETISKPTTPVQGGPLSGTAYALDVFPYESHQIAQKLGLTVTDIGGGWQRAISRLHFQLRFDFDMQNGTVIYRAV